MFLLKNSWCSRQSRSQRSLNLVCAGFVIQSFSLFASIRIHAILNTMRKKIFFLAFSIIAIAFLLAPAGANAQIIPCGNIEAGQPICNLCHAFELLHNIIEFLLIPGSLNSGVAFVLLLATFLIVWGGIKIFLSAGDPTKLQSGKQILTSTLIGLLIIYGSWVAINLVLGFVGVASWSGLGKWMEIKCDVEARFFSPPPIVGIPEPVDPPPLPPGPEAPPPEERPPIVACKSGLIQDNFGYLLSGARVQSCVGPATYATAPDLCASDSHIGDIVSDAGLGTILSREIPPPYPHVDKGGLEPGSWWLYVNAEFAGNDYCPSGIHTVQASRTHIQEACFQLETEEYCEEHCSESSCDEEGSCSESCHDVCWKYCPLDPCSIKANATQNTLRVSYGGKEIYKDDEGIIKTSLILYNKETYMTKYAVLRPQTDLLDGAICISAVPSR